MTSIQEFIVSRIKKHKARLPMAPHMTFDAMDSLARITFCGQAHFAGTGPPGRTCRECEHWLGGGYHHHPSGIRTLKPAPCGRFADLMNHPGSPVPQEALACKYYEAADRPPPVCELI
jgi:hypothetical protein